MGLDRERVDRLGGVVRARDAVGACSPERVRRVQLARSCAVDERPREAPGSGPPAGGGAEGRVELGGGDVVHPHLDGIARRVCDSMRAHSVNEADTRDRADSPPPDLDSTTLPAPNPKDPAVRGHDHTKLGLTDVVLVARIVSRPDGESMDLRDLGDGLHLPDHHIAASEPDSTDGRRVFTERLDIYHDAVARGLHAQRRSPATRRRD